MPDDSGSEWKLKSFFPPQITKFTTCKYPIIPFLLHTGIARCPLPLSRAEVRIQYIPIRRDAVSLYPILHPSLSAFQGKKGASSTYVRNKWHISVSLVWESSVFFPLFEKRAEGGKGGGWSFEKGRFSLWDGKEGKGVRLLGEEDGGGLPLLFCTSIDIWLDGCKGSLSLKGEGVKPFKPFLRPSFSSTTFLLIIHSLQFLHPLSFPKRKEEKKPYKYHDYQITTPASEPIS